MLSDFLPEQQAYYLVSPATSERLQCSTLIAVTALDGTMLTLLRAFTEILRFELRLHLSSPLFWGIALLFFALHLLTLTRTGINLGDNEQIAINSAWLIFQTELVLGVFGMLPAMVFSVTAMTRDDERGTTEL